MNDEIKVWILTLVVIITTAVALMLYLTGCTTTQLQAMGQAHASAMASGGPAYEPYPFVQPKDYIQADMGVRPDAPVDVRIVEPSPLTSVIP